MPSSHGHAGTYDQSLLASAPEATKQMRQEGYNPDIINKPTKVNNTSSNNLHRDLESGVASSKEHLGHTATSTATTPIPSKRVPFYRTTKGKVILGVGALLVIGAIIGGAVGGTRGKKEDDGDGDHAATAAPGSGSGSGGGHPGEGVAPGGGGASSSGAAGAGVASSSTQQVNPFSAISGALSGSGTATAVQPVQTNQTGPPTGPRGQQQGGGGQTVGQRQDVGSQRAATNGALNAAGEAIGSQLGPRL